MMRAASARQPGLWQHEADPCLNDRLAEAARYAVLNRLMPVLRHDVAGAMQSPRMLLMVLDKRLQAADPDLPAIAKNVASINTLTKQATADCMEALSWVASSEDVRVSLRSHVDQAIALLAMELNVNGLTMVNGVADEASASQSFLRSVFMGAVLAFCDQHTEGGTLGVTFEPAAEGSEMSAQLHLRMQTQTQTEMQMQPQMAGDAAPRSAASQDVVRKYRMIGWPDVQAMAQSCGVLMTRGDGWLTLNLP